jgi:hypothetical protein
MTMKKPVSAMFRTGGRARLTASSAASRFGHPNRRQVECRDTEVEHAGELRQHDGRR